MLHVACVISVPISCLLTAALGLLATTHEELGRAVAEAVAAPRPAVVNVCIDPFGQRKEQVCWVGSLLGRKMQ